MPERPSSTNNNTDPTPAGKASANTTMTGAAVPIPATARRPPLRTTGSMRSIPQSPPVDSAMFQQGLLLLTAGTAAIYLALRMVFALIRSLPLIAVGVYLTKPSIESFMEFLSLNDKRSSSSSNAGASTTSPTTGSSKPGGWLKNVVNKTIEKTSAALCLNTVREWLYLDLGLFVLCKKKPSAFEGLSAALSGGTAPPEPKVFAIGLCWQWFLLDTSTCDAPGGAGGGEWSWLQISVYEVACMLSSQWPDAKWHTCSSSPAVQRWNDNQRSAAVDAVVATTAAVVGEAWKEVVETSNQGRSSRSSSSSSMQRNSSSRNTHSHSSVNVSSPPIEESGAVAAGLMGEMEDKPMRRHMRLAQEFAERGRFEEAGRAVEVGLERTRNTLRGGIEEETEVVLVACAFYEAGAPTSIKCAGSRLRCLEEAAGLCVVQERWAKASELFEECVLACLEDRKRGTPHGLVMTGSLVLSAVLAQFMFGDTVRAEGFHQRICSADSRYRQTAEAELVSEVLRGVRAHNPNMIQEARTAYKPKGGGSGGRGGLHREEGGKKRLEHWQEQVVRQMMKRAEAAVLL